MEIFYYAHHRQFFSPQLDSLIQYFMSIRESDGVDKFLIHHNALCCVEIVNIFSGYDIEPIQVDVVTINLFDLAYKSLIIPFNGKNRIGHMARRRRSTAKACASYARNS